MQKHKLEARIGIKFRNDVQGLVGCQSRHQQSLPGCSSSSAQICVDSVTPLSHAVRFGQKNVTIICALVVLCGVNVKFKGAESHILSSVDRAGQVKLTISWF